MVHPGVITVLITCGMTNAQANNFANQHGFLEIANCLTLRPEYAKNMIKTFNNGRQLNQKMGQLHELKLEAFIYWARDLHSRQQSLVVADWTAAQVAASIDDQQAAKDRKEGNDANLPEVGMIQMDAEFCDWSDKFKNRLNSIPSWGMTPMSILYVVREDKPAGWDPATDADSDKERIIYQVLLTGSVFVTGNKRVWDELKKVTLVTGAFEWIKIYEATKMAAQHGMR